LLSSLFSLPDLGYTSPLTPQPSNNLGDYRSIGRFQPAFPSRLFLAVLNSFGVVRANARTTPSLLHANGLIRQKSFFSTK
jgi:hypothetical protein